MGKLDLSINELVSSVMRGNIRLPEMQRGYVWNSSQVCKLLDSLYRGYPSGTILMWQTDGTVEERSFAIAQETPATERYDLLLDGQQRLTSLAAIFRGQPVSVKNHQKPIRLLFNLDHSEWDSNFSENFIFDSEDTSQLLVPDEQEETFISPSAEVVFELHTNKLAAKPNWVSVQDFLTGKITIPDIMRRLDVTEVGDPRYDKFYGRLKRLENIGKYEYRVETLGKEIPYREVTEIFVRVNSEGTKLKGSDLALAQLTAIWRGSLKEFLEFEQECTQSGFAFDVALYLRVMVAIATGQSMFQEVPKIPKADLQRAWDRAKDSVRYTLSFLKENMRIDTPTLLASPFIIVAISYFAHIKNFKLSAREAKLLRYWILIAGAKGRYTRGATETMLDQDLTAIRSSADVQDLIKLLLRQVGRLDILPSDLDGRRSNSGYFKLMFLAFKDTDARDWNNQLSLSLSHAGSKAKLQTHHIFPKQKLENRASPVPSGLIHDISNLAFISGSLNRQLSNKLPSIYLPKIVEEDGAHHLEVQCIPTTKEH